MFVCLFSQFFFSFFFFLQTSVAAAKTQIRLCLAQYCIFVILSYRSPELYQQKCYLVSYIVCLLLSIFGNLGYGFSLVIPKAVNEALNVLIDNPP